MNNGVEVRTSLIHGKGLYATRLFQKGETVIEWLNTRELTERERETLPQSDLAYIEYDGDKTLLVGEPERYVNHSCAANTTPGVRCDVASHRIEAGEKITADYANFHIPGGHMICSCGSPNCRKTIVSHKKI